MEIKKEDFNIIPKYKPDDIVELLNGKTMRIFWVEVKIMRNKGYHITYFSTKFFQGSVDEHDIVRHPAVYEVLKVLNV